MPRYREMKGEVEGGEERKKGGGRGGGGGRETQMEWGTGMGCGLWWVWHGNDGGER